METTTRTVHLDRVLLADEDRARMERLYEEIAGRMKEMSLITARSLGVDLEGAPVARFGATLRNKATERFCGIEWIYRDGVCVGYYDYDAGTCNAGCD